MHKSVLIVGAGVSGVTAAKTLSAAGLSCVLREKSRGAGGRMHSRDGFDAGAQFFTVRSEEFARLVDSEWEAREWCRGFARNSDGYPRYVGRHGMKALVEAEAAQLPEALVSVEYKSRVEPQELRNHPYAAVLVTAPLPQALELLGDAYPGVPQHLKQLQYGETLSLHCVLREGAASPVPPPGGQQRPRKGVHFVADERQKGNMSDRLGITVHGDLDLSRRLWDAEDEVVARELAEPFYEDVTWYRVKRWRYAIPLRVAEERFCELPGNVYLCGDAFGQLGIEGAVLSGKRAAERIIEKQRQEDAKL